MLEKLRAQPDHIKQRAVLGFTIVIFSGVAFVWVSSLGARLESREARAKTVSPIDSVASLFKGIVGDSKTVSNSALSDDKGVIQVVPQREQKNEQSLQQATVLQVVGTPSDVTTFPATNAMKNNDDFDISGMVIIDSTPTPRATTTEQQAR